MIKLFKILTLLLACPLLAQGQQTKALSTKLLNVVDSVVQADMKAANAPGAMILVAQNGMPVYEKPFGLRNAKTKEPVTSGTLFLTASVTKTVTTTTLLVLCHEKGISTDVRIGSILDSLPSQIAALSIHQILSQSSGVLDHKPTRKKWKNDPQAYFNRFGNRLFAEELQGVFSYTNYGHVLAGMLISKLSGAPFEEAVQERIFDPLGMTHCTYSVENEEESDHSAAHRGGKVVEHSYTFPMIRSSASMFCTAGDLTRFASCFMNQGRLEGKQVIPEEVIEKMSGTYTPVGVLHNYFGYPGSNYGYGLMSFDYNGVSFIGHPGETTTQNMLLAMAPDQKTSLVLMSNAGTYPFIETFEFLAKILFPTGKDPVTQPGGTETASKAVEKLTSEQLKVYEGRYYTPDITGNRDTDMEVYSKGSNLYLQLSEDETHKLTSMGNDTFRYDSNQVKFPIEVRFYRDDDGVVRYLNHYWKTSVKKKR